MSNVYKKYDDEIDLLSIIHTIWDGKWKILSLVVISFLSVLGINSLNNDKTFTAKTTIKPITSFETVKYALFNTSLEKIVVLNDINDKKEKISKIFEINKDILLDLYVENIDEGSILENGVDKYNLINRDDFDDEETYKEAVEG